MADKALLLGVNNYKNFGSLRGCLNDVDNMKQLLVDVFSFETKNIRDLRDEDVVKANVAKNMKWLFADARAGDRVLLHFSGHGSFVPDDDGDEADGRDEIVCLQDMDFNDPETYFRDDELKVWTERKPEGVRLVVVMDNCNSGTGTRLLLAPATAVSEERAVRVDVDVSAARAKRRSSSGRRDPDSAIDRDHDLLDPDHAGAVRVRFIDPPPQILRGVDRAKAKFAKSSKSGLGSRDVVHDSALNHVLLTACRADQTAADATIEDKPNGAFTFYLCKTLNREGSDLDRTILLRKLEAAMQEGGFTQVPQLETAHNSGPIFEAADDRSSSAGNPTKTRKDSDASQSTTFVNSAAGWTSAQMVQFAEAVSSLPEAHREKFLSILAGGASATSGAGRSVGGRRLVYVHGICSHPRNFSKEWWKSLHPFTDAFGAGDLDDTRLEVRWSDLVNERGLRNLNTQELIARKEFTARVAGALEERIAAKAPSIAAENQNRDLLETGLRCRNLLGDRGLSVPGLACIDDFTAYMFESGVRSAILQRFVDVVAPLAAGGAEVDVISHSWGTVVAYEALRQLERSGSNLRVRNFFTVGAALSLFPVKQRLLSENRDGRKPAFVKRWINLDAHGDPVGGRMQGNPYQVDAEFLDLSNMGCGFLDAQCAHGSYFLSENDAVNRDVFAAFINQS